MSNNKKNILVVFGTRPEAIKMAPLLKEFKKYSSKFNVKSCVTAQHREILDQVLNFFDIDVDYDLNLMKPNQNLYSLTGEIIISLKDVFEDFKPDYVFVHGDTTTTLASSLACFYFGSKLCHVEAGLRTNDKISPFPEEINRQITSRIADYHFAPTTLSEKNLVNENISKKNIIVTGNTVIDALILGLNNIKEEEILSKSKKLNTIINLKKEIILVTGHRRENFGEGVKNICNALIEISDELPNSIIVYPVHPNPNIQKPVNDLLGNKENIFLINPLPYPEFIFLMNKSKIIISDSGGVQEEAPSLGKPVLLTRSNTERPEALDSKTVMLVGTDKNKIKSTVLNLFKNEKLYKSISKLKNPYGDGTASKKIVKFFMNLN